MASGEYITGESFGDRWITNASSENITVGGSNGVVIPPGGTLQYTVGSNVTSSGGGGGGFFSGHPWSSAQAATTSFPINHDLGEDTISRLMTKMMTILKPEDRVVICVDDDYTDEGVAELAEKLGIQDIKGIIIQGARAGKGFGRGTKEKTSRDARMDLLATIAELWEQKPELKFTDLIEWWSGDEYDDDVFAMCTEVYFKKLTEKPLPGSGDPVKGNPNPVNSRRGQTVSREGPRTSPKGKMNVYHS